MRSILMVLNEKNFTQGREVVRLSFNTCDDNGNKVHAGFCCVDVPLDDETKYQLGGVYPLTIGERNS